MNYSYGRSKFFIESEYMLMNFAFQ